MDDIIKEYHELDKSPYPNGIAGEEVAGIDLMLLLTYCGGIVETYITKKGELNARSREYLSSCLNDLKIVKSNLSGAPKK